MICRIYISIVCIFYYTVIQLQQKFFGVWERHGLNQLPKISLIDTKRIIPDKNIFGASYNVIVQLTTIPDRILKSISPSSISHTNTRSVSSKQDIQAELATIMQEKIAAETTTKSTTNNNTDGVDIILDTKTGQHLEGTIQLEKQRESKNETRGSIKYAD